MYNKLCQLREKRARGEKGFTLIELLVVVVIIGILIAIAIPLYLNYTKGANDKAAASDLRAAVSVMEQCNTDNNSYPTAVSSDGTSITGCSGQSLKTSSGTEWPLYIATPTTDPVTSYILVSHNTKGAGKWYCYDSSVGGSIKTDTAAPTTAC